jgi:HlyD family type I secretion membrane fusion protein
VARGVTLLEGALARLGQQARPRYETLARKLGALWHHYIVGLPADVADEGNSLASELRSTCLFGGGALMVFLVAGILWSSTAALSGAVVASGVVGVDGSRKTIQHLEGGIISEILVTEGAKVKAGQILIVFDDVRVRARVEELENRVRTLAAEESRLRAERASLDTIQFDHPSLEDRDDPEVKATIDQQINQFVARRENMDSRKSILIARKAQLQEQSNGISRQIEGVAKQLGLIREEASTVRELVEKGYDRRPRLLALLREEASLLAREGELMAQLAGNKEAMGEAELRVLSLSTDQMEEIDSLLASTQSKRVSTEKVYWESVNELSRTSVSSPVDGIVLGLVFKTIGGVVRPGEPLLDVVPNERDLIINARLRPQDIDEIHIGMEANVAFPSYAQRYMNHVSGEVIHVSADTITNPKSGESYFEAKIRVNIDDVARQSEEISLSSGMPAEIFIATSQRTFFQYIFQPVSRTYQRAMRET